MMQILQVLLLALVQADQSAIEKELVTETPDYKEILDNHAHYSRKLLKLKFFPHVTLGFVTPWNGHGYDIANHLSSKFTYVSPVWFYIKPRGSSFAIEGEHDVDLKWVNDLKNNTLIVPRFSFSDFENNHYMNLLQSTAQHNIIAENILDLCSKYSFDGAVLEIHVPAYLVDFVKSVSTVLKAANLKLLLVIGPSRNDQSDFKSEHYTHLYKDVDAFCLMTYDYSNPAHPGPNSPIWWAEESVGKLR